MKDVTKEMVQSRLEMVGFKSRATPNAQLLLNCPCFWKGVTVGTYRKCKYHYGFVVGGAKCMKKTLEDKDETN